MKKQEFKKNEERLTNLQDNFKRSNIQIIGASEEEEEQKNKNLFEKIMKENFPNLAKELEYVGPRSSENPKEFGPKEEHTKTHHN